MKLELAGRQERSHPAVFGEIERPQERYTGAERRRQHRRKQTDRREELRFELDKTDRRVCEGRRGEDKNLKFW
jgi:hypothetical protein